MQGGGKVKIEIQLDPNQQETKVIIVTDEITENVKELMNRLSQEYSQVIAGFQQERLEILEPQSIYRIYAANQKV